MRSHDQSSHSILPNTPSEKCVPHPTTPSILSNQPPNVQPLEGQSKAHPVDYGQIVHCLPKNDPNTQLQCHSQSDHPRYCLLLQTTYSSTTLAQIHVRKSPHLLPIPAVLLELR